MTTAEREFSEKFEAKVANPSHRGAYYQEDATDKEEVPEFIEKKIQSA